MKNLITPRATEKAYHAESLSTYIFSVPAQASKQAIKRAIAETFKVTVINVRTLTRKGKTARVSRGKHAYPGTIQRADQKIAYVTVKKGDKIPVFEEAKPAKKDADTKSAKKDADAKPAKQKLSAAAKEQSPAAKKAPAKKRAASAKKEDK